MGVGQGEIIQWWHEGIIQVGRGGEEEAEEEEEEENMKNQTAADDGLSFSVSPSLQPSTTCFVVWRRI